jgi:hypothetical protein
LRDSTAFTILIKTSTVQVQDKMAGVDCIKALAVHGVAELRLKLARGSKESCCLLTCYIFDDELPGE